MSINDRRIVNRKPCVMPIRFLVSSEEPAKSGDVQAASRLPAAGRELAGAQEPIPHIGETVNLSERGVAFKSFQPVSLGQPIELFFTLPTVLTGRIPEDVRCSARVVYVDPIGDPQGAIRIGATIERFERIPLVRSWGN
jgi:PilZ domain-containing protein